MRGGQCTNYRKAPSRGFVAAGFSGYVPKESRCLLGYEHGTERNSLRVPGNPVARSSVSRDLKRNKFDLIEIKFGSSFL